MDEWGWVYRNMERASLEKTRSATESNSNPSGNWSRGTVRERTKIYKIAEGREKLSTPWMYFYISLDIIPNVPTLLPTSHHSLDAATDIDLFFSLVVAAAISNLYGTLYTSVYPRIFSFRWRIADTSCNLRSLQEYVWVIYTLVRIIAERGWIQVCLTRVPIRLALLFSECKDS